MRMKKCLLLMSAAAMLLPSCMVNTSIAVAESCIYEPNHESSEKMQVYRVGDAYYLKVGVRYICQKDEVNVAGIIGVSEAKLNLPISYRDAREAEVMYVLMDKEVVKRYVSDKITTVDDDAPRYLTAADWDASKAKRCKMSNPMPEKMIHMEGTIAQEGCYYKEAKYGMEERIEIYLPTSIGWDALYKFPAAAMLAVSVDVPGTTGASVGGLVVAGAGALFVSPFQRQQQHNISELSAELQKKED